MPCWRCQGTGQIGAVKLEADEQGRPLAFDTCPECSGSGFDPRFPRPA